MNNQNSGLGPEIIDDSSYFQDSELLIRLCILTKGEIIDERNEIKKSLIEAVISEFNENEEISPNQISEIFTKITKCTLEEAQIISILNILEKEEVLEHIGGLKYKIIKPSTKSDFEELSEDVWLEFHSILKSKYSEYDPYIHKNARIIFDRIILRILSRFSINLPLDNQIDLMPITDIKKLIDNEVKNEYLPEDFVSKYPNIIFDYITSSPQELLNLIFNCYQGLINIDIITREQEMPEINFCNQIKFLILDTSFIVTLLCETDAQHPLSHALIELCNKSQVPLYFTEKTYREIWSLINGSKSEMKGLKLGKHRIIQSQFVEDFVNKNIEWSIFISYLNNWEGILQDKWNIIKMKDDIPNQIDEEVYEYTLRLLPSVDKFRYTVKENKDLDYEPRLRTPNLIEHDAYCIALVAYLKENYVSDSGKIFGPWFLSYDRLLEFFNISFIKNSDDFGYVIQPRIILNYIMAYSKIQFDDKDRENVAIAILRYTARAKQSKLSIDKYSKLIAEKIGFGLENSDVLKEIFLQHPLQAELEKALRTEEMSEAETIVGEIISGPEIEGLIQEIVYSKNEKEKNEETIERLSKVIKDQRESIKESEGKIEAYESALKRPIKIENHMYIDVDIKIQTKINNLISLLDEEGAFKEEVISLPPKSMTLKAIRSWLENIRRTLDDAEGIKSSIVALLPYVNSLLTSIT